MNIELHNKCKKIIIELVNKDVDDMIGSIFDEEDYAQMDLSNLADPEKWIIEECYLDFDKTDKYNHEIYNQKKGFDLNTGERIPVKDEDILKRYQFSYIGCEDIEQGTVKYGLLVMKDGSILFDGYCGD